MNRKKNEQNFVKNIGIYEYISFMRYHYHYYDYYALYVNDCEWWCACAEQRRCAVVPMLMMLIISSVGKNYLSIIHINELLAKIAVREIFHTDSMLRLCASDVPVVHSIQKKSRHTDNHLTEIPPFVFFSSFQTYAHITCMR